MIDSDVFRISCLVSMTYTGRIVIPKKIREEIKIKKSDVVVIKRTKVGDLLVQMPKSKYLDDDTKEAVNSILETSKKVC